MLRIEVNLPNLIPNLSKYLENLIEKVKTFNKFSILKLHEKS